MKRTALSFISNSGSDPWSTRVGMSGREGSMNRQTPTRKHELAISANSWVQSQRG